MQTNPIPEQGKKKSKKGLLIALLIALPLMAIMIVVVIVALLLFARYRAQGTDEAKVSYDYETPTVVENRETHTTPVKEVGEGIVPDEVGHYFSVNPYKQVAIAKGNLQYKASTYEWRFANNAWDVMGYENINISSNYNGWIDLFSWGTGGNPTNYSTDNKQYTSFYDWGNRMGGGWRTPTIDEWDYLLSSRPNARNKVGGAVVNGISGIVILPDDWSLPYGCSFIADMKYESNYFDSSLWRKMEQAGAIFLPASGRRDGKELFKQGTDGDYWSSTQHYNIERAYNVDFVNGKLTPRDDSPTKHAFAVRLIKDR